VAAYYNEIDPFAAQWLRNLIAAGHIAPGDVDERSIKDVAPEDLSGFVQCHFFAGIGVWSHALRLAGWPDDRPVWTGSCPCQPFSSAGARLGTADERHLWPDWFNLIRERRPSVIFGEQVEAAVNHGWLDLVQADLESEDYACGAVGMPAAGVGAPHIRQRLWFVANNNNNKRREWDSRVGWDTQRGAEHASDAGELADADSRLRVESDDTIRAGGAAVNSGRQFSELADTVESGWSRVSGGGETQEQRVAQRGTSGFWGATDWLPCRDGKTRPVEPGTFPLAYGSTARVGRLRAYGNAIVPQVAQALIEAYLSCN
jgi:DNA (cytosine-5)-methyltransferase 1